MIKVSVIVPVYNTEKYLKKCLDSLVHQTLNEIEIIVVNDGSPDNSQLIIEDYAMRFPQIKAFRKENGGLSDARNYGIERSCGAYIGFVDSDDFVDARMFEQLYQKAVEHGADIVLCDMEKVDENGVAFRPLPQSPQLPEKIYLDNDFSIFGEMGCFACNKIFKRQLFEVHRFKKGIHFEDIELIPRLVLDSEVIAKVNQPFYKYFERQDSITKTHNLKGLDMFQAIAAVKSAFDKSQYSHQKREWKRFFILQGYYSYLAYVAYVKNNSQRRQLLKRLKLELANHQISKAQIINYKRFNRNYLVSLPIKKQMFYVLGLINLKLIEMNPK